MPCSNSSTHVSLGSFFCIKLLKSQIGLKNSTLRKSINFWFANNRALNYYNSHISFVGNALRSVRSCMVVLYEHTVDRALAQVMAYGWSDKDIDIACQRVFSFSAQLRVEYEFYVLTRLLHYVTH